MAIFVTNGVPYGHYGFRSAATHFMEIQQLRLLYHKVPYTKQRLSSNNQVCRINSVRAAARSDKFQVRTKPSIYEHCVLLFIIIIIGGTGKEAKPVKT